MKTTHKNKGSIRQPNWFWRAGMAGLVLAASVGVSHAMTLQVFNSFNDASTISGMHFEGWNSSTQPPSAFSWASGPTYDAGSLAGSGSLELQCNFSPSIQGGVFRLNAPSINITGYTALEYDVMVDPASPLDSAGNACDLKVGFSDQGWAGHNTDHNVPGVAGWQHVVIPLSSIGGTGPQPIQEITFQEFDNNFSTLQTNKIYIDNVKFTGPDPTYPDYSAFTFDNTNFLGGVLTPWYGQLCAVQFSTNDAAGLGSSGSAYIVANVVQGANNVIIAMNFDTNGTFLNPETNTIDGTHYQAVELDVLWDTNASTIDLSLFNSLGDISGLPLGLMEGPTTGNNGFEALAGGATGIAIPDAASNGWVHMSIPIIRTTAGIQDTVGLYFKKYGNTAVPSGAVAAFYIDNVKFIGAPLAIFRPTMSISEPVKGLNIVNNSGGGYDRESLLTFNTGFSWVDQSDPVTYSMKIAGFPGVQYAGYNARIYLVPSSSATESTPDWTESYLAMISISLNGSGQAVATIGCKNSQGGTGNGNLYDATNPTFTATNSPVVGNWSFRFTQNTNILVTAPSGESTNWTLPLLTSSQLSAQFGTVMEVYFGGYNNGSSKIGQRLVLASVGITKGATTLLYDNFLADTQIDYFITGGSTWIQASGGSVPRSEYLIPANTTTKYYVDWNVPAGGFSLETNSVVDGSSAWATNTALTAAQYGDHMHSEVDVTNLPASGPLFFRLIHP